MGDGEHGPDLVPRLCHIVRWPDFNGYGFNLHAEKGKAGQFIGKVDEGSPAEAAGLKAGDRIVEVNGTNIGNENHQQVVGRIKAGGDETRLLVVDLETDQHYKEEKRVVRGDLPEVKFLTAARDDIEQPQAEDYSLSSTVIQDATNGADLEPEAEPRVMTEDSSQYAPRLCNLVKWADFDGYGFNLHAEKDKPGQYIGLVDPNSPAELGGLREGDRIIEVNGDNIEKQTHVTVIQKIKSGGDKTSMLVVDKATDDYFKSRGQTVCSSMTSVLVISTPARSTDTAENVVTAVVTQQVESAPVAEEPQSLNEREAAKQDGITDSEAVEESHGENGSIREEEEVKVEADSEVVTQDQTSPREEDQKDTVAEDQDQAATEEAGTEDSAEVQKEEAQSAECTPAPVEQSKEQEEETDKSSAADDKAEASQGTASNGINGGAVDEQAALAAVKASEPQPAPVHTSSSSAPSTDLNLPMTAAEMKELIKARKRQDPRQSKTSFESKYKMFEKM